MECQLLTGQGQGKLDIYMWVGEIWQKVGLLSTEYSQHKISNRIIERVK